MPVPPDLDELERLCRAATPGPWLVGAGAAGAYEVHGPDQADGTLIAETYIGPEESANAAFIAAARTAVPALVARIRELEAENGRLRTQIEGHCERIAKRSDLLSKRAEKQE